MHYHWRIVANMNMGFGLTELSSNEDNEGLFMGATEPRVNFTEFWS